MHIVAYKLTIKFLAISESRIRLDWLKGTEINYKCLCQECQQSYGDEC